MASLYVTPKRRGVGLTSLIDVVFILLLFFMLTSSFVRQQQLSLASPIASSSADPELPQRLALTAQAHIKAWGQVLALTDQALLETFDTRKPLVISASENVSVQTLVTALMHLRALGFSQVSIGPLWQEGAES